MTQKRICGFPTERGTACTIAAGKGTSHPGKGACFLHDGEGGGVKKGAAKFLEVVGAHPELLERAEAYLEDENLLSARRELAILKARFDMIHVQPDDSDVPLLRALGDSISRMSRRIQEMEIGKRQYIHITVTANIVSAFSQILIEFLPDPVQRERALARIEEVIGKNISRASARQVAAQALTPGGLIELAGEVLSQNELEI